MNYLNKISNIQDYFLDNFDQYVEMIIYTAVCFFVPLLMGHPQIVVGVLVNTMLIVAALNLKGAKLLPVILVPSLGVLTRGIIFGPFTIFLVYMIPFIWIGNAILVYAFKWLKLHLNWNYALTLGIGSAVKAGFLFLSALVMYKLGFVPVIFLTAMGLVQLITALIGGIMAFGFHETKKWLS
ncbi:hypothetical protein GF361_05095 [Candidatus Woesearchaeota archaeon]|nr:hypothetical protein [Candidatus Woesearchaeota archaeon]